jgi:hypothetical protein
MRHRPFALLVSALLLPGFSATAIAQTGPVPAATVTQPRIGDCTIRVTIANPPLRGWLKVDLNKEAVARKRIDKDSAMVAVAIKGPILDGDRLRARILVDGMPAGTWSAEVDAAAGTGVAECEAQEPSRDDRDAFEASGYAGIAYDNFAAPQTGNYRLVNPEDAGTSQTRAIIGTDVQGRLFGKPGQNVQLWWFGETLYGVRSQDVDCASESAAKLCGDLKDPKDPSKVLANAHYILAHATSMEFYLGPRLELWTFQRDTDLPAKLYVTGRFGYLALAESAARNVAMYHIGGGLLSPAGTFSGSYVEMGWGKTENLSPKWNRFKLDAYLSFQAPGILKKAMSRMFFQLYVDQSMGGSYPDSIQTFMGAEYDISKWFGK